MPDLPGIPKPGERNIWRERLNAILKVVEILRTRLTEEEKDSRAILLINLLNRLQLFANDHFEFFIEGFADEPKEIELVNPLDDLQVPSVEYVFGTILHQISNDITVFQRIQEQRKSASDNEQPLLLERLDLADKLAYIALQQLQPFLPASDQEAPPTTPTHSVLSYFHLAANTRVLPYAPVALIGMPLSAAKVNRDFLAIPHELGHYLFWHGNVNSVVETSTPSLRFNVRKEIATAATGAQDTGLLESLSVAEDALPLLQQHPWLLPWAEEFFADVVSCLIAGPIVALYFQDLLLQTRSDWMYMDNGTYPAAAIRPYIYSETFKMLFPSSNTGEQLETRWQTMLTERGIKEVDFFPYVNPYLEKDTEQDNQSSHVHSTVDGTPELRVQAVVEVKEIVRVITQQVVTLVGGTVLTATIQQAWQTNPWYLDLGDLNLANAHDVEKAYLLFEGEHVEKLVAHFDALSATQENASLLNPSKITNSSQPWFDLLGGLNIKDDVVDSTQHGQASIPFDSVNAALDAIEQWHQNNNNVGDGPKQIPPAVWKPILEFAGWTTEGPTDGNLHP